MSRTRRESRFLPVISSDEPPPSITPQGILSTRGLSPIVKSDKQPKFKVEKPKPDKPKPEKSKPEKSKPEKSKPDKLKPDKLKPDKLKRQERLKHEHESPWESYGFIDEINKDGETVTKVRKFVSGKIFAFRVFPNDDKSEVIEQQFKILPPHHNVLRAEEFFRYRASFYIRSPVIDVSFYRIVMCRQYPSSRVLASMIGQTMDGLQFLVRHGIICNSITSSKILVTEEGCVKIVAFSDAKIQDQICAPTDVLIRRLASIMTLVMQKFENEIGESGISDQVRWPPQDRACEFLRCLQTAKDLNDTLHKHPFIDPKARDGEGLIDLVVKTSDTTLDLVVELSQDEQLSIS